MLADGSDEDCFPTADAARFLCRVCVKAAVERGACRILEIRPPRHCTFVARANEWVHAPHIVSRRWDDVKDVEPHTYRIAMIDSYVTPVVANVLVGENAGELFSFSEAFEEGVFRFILFSSASDKSGTLIQLDPSFSFEEYEEQLEEELRFAAHPFLATTCDSAVVPSLEHRAFFYHPLSSLTWYASPEEVEQTWSNLDTVHPSQITLEENEDEGRKRIKRQ